MAGATEATATRASAAAPAAAGQGAAGDDAEWAVLEALCLSFADRRPLPAEAVQRMHCQTFSWGTFLMHATTHKLHLVAASQLLTSEAAAFVPKRIRALLQDAWLLNQHKARLLAAEAVRVTSAAATRDVVVVVRKGIAFDFEFYGAMGARTFADIDYLVLPAARASAMALFSDLGYSVGDFDHASATIVPMERRRLAAYRLNPDHLPKMVVTLDDPVIRFVDADVANSLTWHQSAYTVPLEQPVASARALRLGAAGDIRVLPADYQFLDTVLHLFREAYVETVLREDNAITLSAFLDVVLCWRWCLSQGTTSDMLGALVHRLELSPPVSWVLAHTDALFGTTMLAALGRSADGATLPLASWQPMDGRPGRWHGDLRRRLIEGGGIRPE